jgi:tetratricopeptide (TPR) repeat protein
VNSFQVEGMPVSQCRRPPLTSKAGDVNGRWRPSRVAALLVAACLATAGGCGPAEQAPDHRQSAIARLAEGDPGGALAELRQAIRQAPDDAGLRLLTADAYLAEGRGDLAEVALDQALDRGAEPHATLTRRAQALMLQQRYGAVRALEVPADAPAAVALAVGLMQIRSLAAQRDPDRVDDDLTRQYLAWFQRLDDYQGPERGQFLTLAEEERGRRATAERAWQHHVCGANRVETTVWQPPAIDGRPVLHVGPGRTHTTPAEAAAAARDGDVVLIDPGTYPGGVALWPQSRLLVLGLGERPRITAAGRSVQRRDVWLFTGNDVTVENVAISGARSPYRNGAGIRHIGRGLTLRHVHLEDNENGVLTGNNHPDSVILIEHSEFADNGDGEGQAHNIYVGRSERFVLRYSYSHGAKVGHLVKSRARDNLIAYNRLADGMQGESSYLIDLPEAGVATIIGNELNQGPRTPNHGMISFASEGQPHADNRLTIASNSVYNQDFGGILLRNHGSVAALIVNNLIGGAPVSLAQSAYDAPFNLTLPNHGMADPRNHDFTLTPGAPAIDAAVEGPTPLWEYVHPLGYRPRPTIWRADAGAHEHCGL